MSDETTHAGPAGHPAAGPQHQKLEPFAGQFRATVKLWMGPGEPMVTSGLMVNTFQLGGLYLHQDYAGDVSADPFPAFMGKGYWGFNTATGKYEGFWIDNASTMMQLETGEVDAEGKVWTMHSEFTDPRSGQPLRKRSVITLIDRDRHRMESFFTSGGQEMKAMEIEYVRA